MFMAERFEEKQKNEGFGSSSLGRLIGGRTITGSRAQGPYRSCLVVLLDINPLTYLRNRSDLCKY